MKIRANANVVYQYVDNTVILLNAETDSFYTLNRTGARFWELLNEKLDVKQIIERMTLEFEVSEAQLTEEIKDMIASLLKENLVQVDND